jgi:hypothetical protein
MCWVNFSHADYADVKEKLNQTFNDEYGYIPQLLGDLQGPNPRSVMKEL